MSHRASLRTFGISLLVSTIVAGGFVAADLARGASGSTNATSTPSVGATTITKTVHTVPASWLGRSGRLRAVIETPSALTSEFATTLDTVAPVPAPVQPGLHDMGIVTPNGEPFYVVSMVPYEAKQGSRLNGYFIGNWPQKAKSERYAPPAGFIEVTEENAATPISQSFRLQDFLTHDQAGVWPKYLVLKPRLLDKLELIAAALAERGLPSRLHVMSGFRTPQYNEQGVGEKGGRASMSRHMYGDAADVFVDADADGVMDDLNADGRVTVADARVLFSIAESVEAAHPDLIGGLSPYKANSAHGPFVHVDARGVKARW